MGENGCSQLPRSAHPSALRAALPSTWRSRGAGHPPPSDRLKLPEGPDQAASNVEIAAGTVTDVSGTLSDMSSERPISLRNDPSDVSPEEQRPTDRPTDTRRTGLLTLG